MNNKHCAITTTAFRTNDSCYQPDSLGSTTRTLTSGLSHSNLIGSSAVKSIILIACLVSGINHH